jgi:CubicO group peptidase (beta-lactamase class C family)
MLDTGFTVPADKLGRLAKPLARNPVSDQPQAVSQAPLKLECGGSCAVSTASDYLRFAAMLMNKGSHGGTRILGRKTVEYMLANQLGPEVKNLIGTADPTRADYGFGLGLAVRTTPGIVRLLGSVGDFSWPGATGTNWWADPKEELVVVWMAATPGELRWKYRQMINALVYQAIVD